MQKTSTVVIGRFLVGCRCRRRGIDSVDMLSRGAGCKHVNLSPVGLAASRRSNQHGNEEMVNMTGVRR